MADRPNSIQFLLTEHGIDHTRAAHLGCPPNRIMVEMLPESNRLGLLFLPDQVSKDCRPDIGIILAVGPDVAIEPGAMVAVRGYDGQWIEEFAVPGYSTSNQVRFFGKYTQFQGETQQLDWDESVVCRIFPEDESMQAVGRNLIIERDPLITEQNGFVLPDAEQYHTGLATVVSIGPACHLETLLGEVKVGDRVHYDTRSVLDFEFKGELNSFAIIPDIGVNCVVACAERG